MIFGGRSQTAAMLALAIGVAGQVSAQEATPSTVSETAEEDYGQIVVVGDNGTSYRLTPDSLRDAAQNFTKHRGEFAPASTLYFKINLSEGEAIDGLRFVLRPRKKRAGGDTIDVTIDDQNRLLLPVDLISGADWELRSNRTGDSIKVRPLVLSPGSTATDRRFGDIRLQCRVSVAFARLSGPLRLLASAVNPCGNSHIGLYTKAEGPLSAVTLEGYAKPLLRDGEDRFFHVPVSDETVSNEARIKLFYK